MIETMSLTSFDAASRGVGRPTPSDPGGAEGTDGVAGGEGIGGGGAVGIGPTDVGPEGGPVCRPVNGGGGAAAGADPG
ncbi:hypothetical protein Acsp06_18370 [Actinomycetospora sp. NBRC 106375]|nr:hypothetical protein Acsp06_18370 [Actinomycetospora sp. NBRC 106375]